MGVKNRKVFRRKRIKHRIRKTVYGTAQCPRLSVFRSNEQIYAQIINDDLGTTIVSASSQIPSIHEQKVSKIEKAKLVGAELSAKALEAGVSSVVFDRNGYLYHGRVKSLAEAAREGGLQF